MLDEVPEGAAQAGGDQVRGVAEEDGGFGGGGEGVCPGALGGVLERVVWSRVKSEDREVKVVWGNRI